MGTLDAGGFVRIDGRIRDVIIRGGENIYPAEVEEALLLHPAIMAAAVVGVPDDRWSQQVAAAITIRAGHDLEPAQIEEHAATRLAHFKVPRIWMTLDTLPQTPNGKISKLAVERLFAQLPEGMPHD